LAVPNILSAAECPAASGNLGLRRLTTVVEEKPPATTLAAHPKQSVEGDADVVHPYPTEPGGQLPCHRMLSEEVLSKAVKPSPSASDVGEGLDSELKIEAPPALHFTSAPVAGAEARFLAPACASSMQPAVQESSNQLKVEVSPALPSASASAPVADAEARFMVPPSEVSVSHLHVQQLSTISKVRQNNVGGSGGNSAASMGPEASVCASSMQPAVQESSNKLEKKCHLHCSLPLLL